MPCLYTDRLNAHPVDDYLRLFLTICLLGVAEMSSTSLPLAKPASVKADQQLLEIVSPPYLTPLSLSLSCNESHHNGTILCFANNISDSELRGCDCRVGLSILFMGTLYFFLTNNYQPSFSLICSQKH